MAQTLASYLKLASVNVVPPAKASAAPAPAPTPTPAPAPVKAAAAPAPAPAPAQTKAAETQPRPSVMYDPAVIKTAEQKWLLERGAVITDEKLAATIVQNMVKSAEAQKTAELMKFAAEMEARGVLQFHGMLKESCAMRLADGDCTGLEVLKTAMWTGCSAQDIINRTNELKKLAELAAASSGAAFFGDERGSAARSSNSEVMGAAERNQNTTSFEPETVAGTRPAARGVDAKELRFQDTVTMPNNPGLNHGQQTDNGKSGV